LARTHDNTLARLKQFLVERQGAGACPGSSRSDTPSAAGLFDRITDLWGEFYPVRRGRLEGAIVSGQDHPTTTTRLADEPESGPRYDILLKDRDLPDGVPVDDRSSGEIEALSMIGTFVMELCWTRVGTEAVATIQSLLITCRLQDVDPYDYLLDVLQRIDTHPAKDVHQLTPRLWKRHFADNPLRSDLHILAC
jgi:hypothetical protein